MKWNGAITVNEKGTEEKVYERTFEFSKGSFAVKQKGFDWNDSR